MIHERELHFDECIKSNDVDVYRKSTFSEKLRALMEKSGITQTKLSEMTGICKSSLSQYLSGKNEPRGKALSAIADAFEVSVDWFYASDDEGSSTNLSSINNLPIKKAAELMGVSQQYIRVGLQIGLLPFGAALKINGSKYRYYISPKKFSEYTGVEIV